MKELKLDELKLQFDRVKLFHSKEQARSIAVFIKGDVAYVGVAKCATGDDFSKRRGRQIALGRAMFAYNVATGKEQERVTKRSEVLSFSREVDITKEDLLGQIFAV